MMRGRRYLWAVFTCVVVAGCAAPPPFEEYTISRTALSAARDVEAGRYASGYWHRAEELYRRGQKQFKDNDYARAKESFQGSLEYSERAENATRLRKFQSGEGSP